MGHYVYKYVLNDEIIYIGKNDSDLPTRIKQHGKPGDNIPREGWSEIRKASVFFIKLANAHMSDVVECELIRRYAPKYNIAGTRSWWSGLPFAEPEWIPYETIAEKKQPKKETVRKVRRSRMPKIMENIQRNAEKRPKIERLLKQIQKQSEGEVRIPITDTQFLYPLGVSVKNRKGSFWKQNVGGHIESNAGKLHFVHRDRLHLAEELKILLCMIGVQEEYAKSFVRITDEYPSIDVQCKGCQKDCIMSPNG